MATLTSIRYTPHRCAIIEGDVRWSPVRSERFIGNLPQIVWRDSAPWREANLWALERATSGDVDLKTVQANVTSLLTYANWLEEADTDWWDFPARKADRCLVRFRGALITARDEGRLAPSTASQRMRDVVHFYRWLQASRLFSPEWPLWRERVVGIHLTDAVGFERTTAGWKATFKCCNVIEPTAKMR